MEGHLRFAAAAAASFLDDILDDTPPSSPVPQEPAPPTLVTAASTAAATPLPATVPVVLAVPRAADPDELTRAVQVNHAALENAFEEYERFFVQHGPALHARGGALVMQLIALTGALSARCAGFAKTLAATSDAVSDARCVRLERQLALARADVEAERSVAAEGILRVERRRVAEVAEASKAASAQRAQLVERLSAESARKVAALERRLALESERHREQIRLLHHEAHATLAVQRDAHGLELERTGKAQYLSGGQW